MRSSLQVAVLASLVASGTALASVVLPLSVEQLTEKATLIVRGKVTALRADPTRGGRIVTTTTIAVDKTLKGAGPASVDVRTLGGAVGGVAQQVSGESEFAVGEEVLVFLRPSGLKGTSYAVVGMAQGTFAVTADAGSTMALQNLDGLAFAEERGAPLSERQGVPVPVTELEARIARLVAK